MLYQHILKRVYVKVKKEEIRAVKMSIHLSQVHGLPSNAFKQSRCGDQEPTITNGGLDAMYIYANFV